MGNIHIMPQSQIDGFKEEYLSLLKSVKRKGTDELCDWLLNETDFFSAPASAKGHGGFEGGLVLHSLNVLKLLKNFTKQIDGINEESLIIVGLLHDLCKANFYKKTVKNVKVPGEKRWVEEEGYMIEDSFPMGHGEKSLFLAQRYIDLTDEEAMAIRWHMSGYDDAARSYAGGMAQSAAFERYPLAVACAIADMYATYFMDKRI